MPNTFSKSAAHILQLLTGKPTAEEVDMSRRNVIVTGASPHSIGYETARILAGWGATVVVTNTRNTELMESSLRRDLRIGGGEKRIAARTLDLCDVGSVNDFARWYRKNYDDRLHVLVNNAGILRNVLNPRKKPPMTKDGFEVHWRTNFLGTFHLTSLLLPVLKQSGLESGDARVVNVTSHLHDRARNKSMFDGGGGSYHSWDAYGLSKLALIHFTFEIQRRFAGKYNLQSAAVNPGSVKTNLTQVWEFEGKIGHLLNRSCSALASVFLISPALGAQTSVTCASRYPLQGGSYYERCETAEPSDDAKDRDVSKLLWDRSDAWVKTLAKTGGSGHEQF